MEHVFFDFPYIGNVIIPADKLIFFRGVGIPPTGKLGPKLPKGCRNSPGFMGKNVEKLWPLRCE